MKFFFFEFDTAQNVKKKKKNEMICIVNYF